MKPSLCKWTATVLPLTVARGNYMDTFGVGVAWVGHRMRTSLIHHKLPSYLLLKLSMLRTVMIRS
jgi:hypothetical protein